jgi:hypothetical protein
MVKIDTILIHPDYSGELIERNRDLVGFVIDKYTFKVKDVAVIPRHSIHTWYEKRRSDYPQTRYELVIGSISLIGSVVGVETKEVEEKSDKSKGTTRENYGLN